MEEGSVETAKGNVIKLGVTRGVTDHGPCKEAFCLNTKGDQRVAFAVDKWRCQLSGSTEYVAQPKTEYKN